MTPEVAADAPSGGGGWRPVELARPKIAESAGASWIGWRATAPEHPSATFVSGCVATPIPGWVDDMRPAVDARAAALAGAVAEKVTGFPMDGRADGDALALRPASELGGPPVGRARALVGFDAERVVTCFAVCAARERGGRWEDCAAAAGSARLVGGAPPPAPGIALRGVTWAVHHPGPAATAGGSLVILAGFIAIAARRRPRSLGAMRRSRTPDG